jgi:DNA polymerase-3 subunit alpha
MTAAFVHLHLHTEYSLTDGLVRVAPLMNTAYEAGMPAVALTDYNNLFALVKFYRAAIARGIKPIIGVDTVVTGVHPTDPLNRIVLLCQNETGYRNLTRLVTRAHLDCTLRLADGGKLWPNRTFGWALRRRGPRAARR